MTFAIDRPDQRRKNATVHVTAVKKWMPLIADTLFLPISDSQTPEVTKLHYWRRSELPSTGQWLDLSTSTRSPYTLEGFPYAPAPKLGRVNGTQDNYRKPHTSEDGFLQSAGDLGRTLPCWIKETLKGQTGHAVCICQGSINVCSSQESPRTNPPS